MTDFVQLVAAIAIVRPWTTERCNSKVNCDPGILCGSSIAIMVAGFAGFWLMQRVGEHLIGKNNEVERRAGESIWVETASNAAPRRRVRAGGYEEAVGSAEIVGVEIIDIE